MTALLALVLACAACTGAAHLSSGVPTVVEGSGKDRPVVVHATFREAALPGARIEWRRSLADGGPPLATVVTDAGGKASVGLPPGRYFLVAAWRKDGDHARPIAPGDRFAYFGGNPVFLAGGAVREFFLSLEEYPLPPPGPVVPARGSGAYGYVLADGAPLAGARVSAYPASKADAGFRDMEFAATSLTASDGGFVLDLPPGDYFLVARLRAGGGAAGPMRKGDFFGYCPHNPVEVREGALAQAVIPATLLKLRNVPSYADGHAAAAFVEGRILGADGKPRRGVYAALYDNPDLLNRPVFMSDVTGADGRYRLPVPAPGKYYLGARNGYGGSPAPGDLYGRFEGNAEHSVEVAEGKTLTGMDIVVEEVR